MNAKNRMFAKYLDVSVGIPAYNEEKNIGRLLASLLHQKTSRVRIAEILVISSSTDGTNEIVNEFSKVDSRVKLIEETERRGKASAVNTLVNEAEKDIVVLESADTIPEVDAVEKLILPFSEEEVGMAAAHPMPVNSQNTFIGYVSHLLWHLHHSIALKRPKCGEMIAFRRIFEGIPEDICVDEAWIEYEVLKRGYKIVYVPDAIVYNKGPETIDEFLKQRRRISCGHIDLQKRTGYQVSSQDLGLLLQSILKAFPIKEPGKYAWFIGAFVLESLGRLCGYFDYYVAKKSHTAWSMVVSTKNLDVGDTVPLLSHRVFLDAVVKDITGDFEKGDRYVLNVSETVKKLSSS